MRRGGKRALDAQTALGKNGALPRRLLQRFVVAGSGCRTSARLGLHSVVATRPVQEHDFALMASLRAICNSMVSTSLATAPILTAQSGRFQRLCPTR